MYALPFMVNAGPMGASEYVVLYLITKTDKEKMEANDPGEMLLSDLGHPWDKMRCIGLTIGMSSEEDTRTILKLCEAGKKNEAMTLLTRGNSNGFAMVKP